MPEPLNKLYKLTAAMVAPFLFLHLIDAIEFHRAFFIPLLISLAFCLATGVSLQHARRINNRMLRTLCVALLICVYLAVLLTVVATLLLQDFTGRGFSIEVFYHFEWQSVRIAVHEYRWHLLSAFAAVAALVWLFLHLSRPGHATHRPRWPWLAPTVLLLSASFSPMAQLGQAYLDYTALDYGVEVKREALEPYRRIGVLNTLDLTTRATLQAEAPEQPRNLIVVYLESFNRSLINHPDYPGLTPQLERLYRELQPIEHLSSAFVTIEGIIDSQCGLAYPMLTGNNSLMEGDSYFNELPCLGDVLSRAGYTQYYLGGANSGFAGKGEFLRQHGFHSVHGWEHWRDEGKKIENGVWGLSDTELFAEALNTLEQARNSPPYSVTMLTLGTHIPGYVYNDCPVYREGAPVFLNAVHCTDHLTGAFVDALAERGFLDEALLLIIADHGVFKSREVLNVFGEATEDRQLVALTNAHEALPALPMSSYDVAPTVLDLLSIRHNVAFLYGRSLLSADKTSQRHVTRYFNWVDGLRENAVDGECRDPTAMQWPLNRCEVNNLMQMTAQVLNGPWLNAMGEHLDCAVEISLSLLDKSDHVLINGVDHFQHFYRNGHYLKPKSTDEGDFLLLLDAQRDVLKHLYFNREDGDQSDLQAALNNTEHARLLLSQDRDGGDAQLRWYPAGAQAPDTALNDAEGVLNLCTAPD